jgi:hypothetical protein
MTGGIVNLLMDSGAVNVVVAVGIVHLCNTTKAPTYSCQASILEKSTPATMPRGLWATIDHQLAEAEAEAGSSRMPLSDRFRIDSEMPVHMRTCTHTGQQWSGTVRHQ